MEKSLAQALADGQVLLADGAAGTMLMAAGLPAGTPPELWNVENPAAILALHRAYVEAGSNIILSNTFGANRVKLGKAGLAERADELNRAGVALARQAADGRVYVAGDMGPTGELLEPLGPLSFEAALSAYRQQALALAAAGVDALWIETMTDLEESRAAVMAARAAAPGLPVFLSMSFGRKARTLMGVRPRQAIEELWPLGLSAIGANCGEGLEVVAEALEQMHAAQPSARLIAKPNAGLPRLEDGRTVYDTGPAEFAARTGGFLERGACIVGACCGSSPEFIAAIAAGLKSG